MPKNRTAAPDVRDKTTPTIGAPPRDLKVTDIDLAEDTILWSVTTIIGALDKPALLYWAAQMTAEAAIDDQATWRGMLSDRGRDEAVKWLRDARFRPGKTMLSSSDLGTVVHALCQGYALSGVKPDRAAVEAEVAKYAGRHTDLETETKLAATMLDRFDEWAARFQPSYLAAEMTVYHPTFGFAGQLDSILTIEDPLGSGPVCFISDTKTSREPLDNSGKPRRPYAEQVGLQLAAYRFAQFCAIRFGARRFEEFRRRYYALSADERAMAMTLEEAVGRPIDTGLVVHITPAICEAFPIRCDEAVFKFFLFCLESFRWVNEVAPTVMGDPLREAI